MRVCNLNLHLPPGVFCKGGVRGGMTSQSCERTPSTPPVIISVDGHRGPQGSRFIISLSVCMAGVPSPARAPSGSTATLFQELWHDSQKSRVLE